MLRGFETLLKMPLFLTNIAERSIEFKAPKGLEEKLIDGK